MSGRVDGSGLRLDCLGSANAFSYGRYWSGFVVDSRIMLDCPPQALVHLHQFDIDSRQIELILITHEHSDHLSGLDPFLLQDILGATEPRTRPLAVAGPPGLWTRVREMVGNSIRLPPHDDPRVTWLEHPGGSSFEWAGAKIECVEMTHAPEFIALGYRVHVNGRVIGYSGDTRMCDALGTLADGADLLIVEGGGLREHHHMAWEDVFTLREQVPQSTRILVTHYDPRDVPDVSQIEGLELAQDLARYEV